MIEEPERDGYNGLIQGSYSQKMIGGEQDDRKSAEYVSSDAVLELE